MAAVTTILTVLIALFVAVREGRSARAARSEAQEERRAAERERHRAAAKLVSGWVEEEYIANENGTAYIRKARAFISNEGDQPIFKVAASVHVGSGRSIGPLAIPAIIPVIPARRHLEWDLTIPLLAHDDTEAPRLEVRFTDPNNKRWVRSPDGDLVETTGEQARLYDTEIQDGQLAGQIGRGDALNPWAVAFNFVNLLQEGYNLDNAVFDNLLDPTVTNWREGAQATSEGLREDLSKRGFAGFVNYPAPHVARVKLPLHEDRESTVAVGDVQSVDMSIVQLTYMRHRGWRVFAYYLAGASVHPPDQIPFPPGTLLDDDKVAPYVIDDGDETDRPRPS